MYWNKWDVGKRGEEVAKEYLLSKGYKILKVHYKKRYGEIDIIAEDNIKVIFVEVKAKYLRGGYKNEGEMVLLDRVGKRKIENLQRLAEEFLQEYNISDKEVRFDIIMVYFFNKEKYFLEHLEDAI